MRRGLGIIFFWLFYVISYAQAGADSLSNRFNRIDRLLNILHDFRIQSYVQPEWQKAGATGIASYSGGNFPAFANNRFLLRRGRFHLTWQHETINKHGDTVKVGEFAFNFDVSEKGFNAIKAFNGRIIDPWTGWFGLQGGIFSRPFGYEQTPSTATMESPEYARINQILLPNEVDLGEALVIESPRTFKPIYLRVDASIVNGEGVLNTGTGQTGINTGAYQSAKDFIARILIGKLFKLPKETRISINGSASYYNGRVMQTTNNIYEVVTNSVGATFKNITSGTPDTAGKFHTYYNRNYYSAYLHLNFDYVINKNLSATTMLRGEFLTGQQPGQLTSSSVPLGTGTAVSGADLYIRKFQGFIACFTQSFHYNAGKQQMHSDFTLKYDSYDPNTQIKGANINSVAGFSTTDIAYHTIGVGYTWCPVPYFKIIFWYDHVINENSGISGWATDNKKDDVFTLRTQFMIDTWWFDIKRTNNSNYISRAY